MINFGPVKKRRQSLHTRNTLRQDQDHISTIQQKAQQKNSTLISSSVMTKARPVGLVNKGPQAMTVKVVFSVISVVRCTSRLQEHTLTK